MSLTFADPALDAVITLLGASVMADREDRDAELIEFCHSAQLITQYMCPEIVCSRAELSQWFRDHRERLQAVARSKTAFAELLARVGDAELRRRALAAMYAIFVCDYRLADEENDLLQLARSVWRAPAPASGASRPAAPADPLSPLASFAPIKEDMGGDDLPPDTLAAVDASAPLDDGQLALLD